MKAPHQELVLSRAARILEAFSQEEPALTVSEIARRTGLHVATASRLVGELVAHGFLVRDDDRRTTIAGSGSVFGSGNSPSGLRPRCPYGTPRCRSWRACTTSSGDAVEIDDDLAVDVRGVLARYPGGRSGAKGLRWSVLPSQG